MRNSKMLRYGLASVTIFGAGLSAFVVACGDDDSTGGTSTSSSSSTSSTSSSSTSSSSGGNPEGGVDSGPPVEPAKLQLVNAATDFGPGPANGSGALRICYKVGPSLDKLIWAPLPPLPNRARTGQPFPGVFAGTGGPVDATGNDLSALVVVPYIFSAQKLAAIGLGSTVTAGQDKSCEDLLTADAGGELKQNVDYWILPELAAGSFQQKKSYILILSGCAADSTKGATCGAGFTPGAPGNGTLTITNVEVDRETTVEATSLGVQFVNASPNITQFINSQVPGEAVEPAITSDKADAAAAKPLNNGSAVAFRAFTALKKIEGVTAASDSVTVNAKLPPFAVSFGNISALSFGAPNPAVYANGKSFTFIALGDPNASPADPNGPGGFNLKSFHYLGLPNDPTISTYDPNK